jgi:HD-like signal output (HDOD) protein
MSSPQAGVRDDCPTIAGIKIEDVGVLPQVVGQINELAERPSTRAEEVARLILRDPTLTSKILRILNSAYYGLRREIHSLQHAVAYLGIQQIRNLVISSALVESFRFEHGFVEPDRVWEHSLGCAIGAKRIGDTLPGVDGDGAYLGGLLHDLGRIILLSQRPEDYREVVDVCERGLCTLREAEESRFGVSHEEAGCALGEAWGFSEPVLAAIRYHHRPAEAGPMVPLVAAVGFANAVCHQEGIRFGFEVDEELTAGEKETAWEVLIASDPSHRGLQRELMEQRVAESIRETRGVISELL